MNHAFMILAHKSFEQIEILINNLKFGDIYIHVDKKNTGLYKELINKYGQKTNVYILRNRINVNWSGFSIVEATLLLIEEVSISSKEYDFVHLISGQDMILMTHDQLDVFLSSKGKNTILMECNDIGKYRWRLKRYSLFRENPNNRRFIYRVIDNILRYLQFLIPERKNLVKLSLYKGSEWFSIPFECIKYINKEANNYINDFKYTACSDEHFFQILIMNSKFKENVINNNARYIIFEKNNSSPNTLTLKDYNNFMNGEYIFARKFDMAKDKDVLELIQKKLSNGIKHLKRS